MLMNVEMEETWKNALADECEKEYFKQLVAQVQEAYLCDQPLVYPPTPLVFNAFNLTPLPETRVVILGQDPYHGPGQAMGLSFSVPEGVKIPPSLQNIYKEIQADIGIAIPDSGNLEHWAKQGVLLLNSTLTVADGNAGSHQGIGWEQFTDTVIKTISAQRENVVFLLWGNFARSKAMLIDQEKHLVLEAPHPSPLSAHRGFLGCGHFSKTNKYLKQCSQKEIVW